MIGDMQETIDKQKDKLGEQQSTINEQQQTINKVQKQAIQNAVVFLQELKVPEQEIRTQICK